MSQTAANQSLSQVMGFGTVMSIGGPTGVTGTETFTTISEIKSIKRTGSKTSTTMATNFGSGGFQLKLGTVVDLGTISFTANRIGNDPGQLAVNAAQLTRQAYDFKIQMPINQLIGQVNNGDVIALSGIVTSAGSFDISIDAVSEYTFEVDVNSYSVTAGS